MGTMLGTILVSGYQHIRSAHHYFQPWGSLHNKRYIRICLVCFLLVTSQYSSSFCCRPWWCYQSRRTKSSKSWWLSGGFLINPQAMAPAHWVQGTSIGELNGNDFIRSRCRFSVAQGQVDNQPVVMKPLEFWNAGFLQSVIFGWLLSLRRSKSKFGISHGLEFWGFDDATQGGGC